MPDEVIKPIADPNPNPVAQPLLDLDGEDVASVVPKKEPDPDPTPVVPEGSRIVSEQEYALMVEKANVVDLINGNPQLSQYVSESLNGNIGNPQEPAAGSDEWEGVDIGNHPYIKEMEKRIVAAEQSAKTSAAAAEIVTFRADHQDMDGLRDAMTPLIRDHSMSISQAYEHAKAMAQPGAASGETRPLPAEGKGRIATEGSDVDSDILAAAAAKINNPNAKVRIGDAMDIAFEAAKQLHNQEI